MKTLIYFNASDKISNIPQSLVAESLSEFVDANRGKFTDLLIVGDTLTFTKAVTQDNEIVKGYAMVFKVPTDFQN